MTRYPAACRAAAIVVCAAALAAASPRPPLGLDLYRPVPETNPLTPEKIALGRQLFHDRQLSNDGSLSCAGCHDPSRAFTDGRATAHGVGGAVGSRNVPALLNRAWGVNYFWDGRATTLEQQALEPILNPRELAMTPDAVLALLRSTRYRRKFIEAFGEEPTLLDAARALASYVRTIEAGDAPYDRYLAGDRAALGNSARRGFALFTGKAGCSSCHSGPVLTDEKFHNTGVAWRTGRLTDEGRERVTHDVADRGAFKTPTLREILRTAPYMHDGSFRTLDEVIDYYDAGGAKNPGLDARLRPLHLTFDEKHDLREFLHSLSGVIRDGR
jgi:cytochrome c peroxidase